MADRLSVGGDEYATSDSISRLPQCREGQQRTAHRPRRPRKSKNKTRINASILYPLRSIQYYRLIEIARPIIHLCTYVYVFRNQRANQATSYSFKRARS